MTVSHPPSRLADMNSNTAFSEVPIAPPGVAGVPYSPNNGTNGTVATVGVPERSPWVGVPPVSWTYLWRRTVVLAALALLLWGSLWAALQLGGAIGARLVAPALGTAPVPVVAEARGDPIQPDL